MDRITKSYLDDFIKSFGLEAEKNQTKQFEHFVDYTLVDRKVEERFDNEELNIGKDSTLGIDGFAIILNKRIIVNEDELNDFLSTHSNISAEIVFIQTKTSTTFNTKEIGNFGWAVTDFISESPKINWSKEKIALFNKLIKHTAKLKEKPLCYLYFVTLGAKTDDQNISAKIEDVKNNIQQENLFNKIYFELIGANEIQFLYKKIGQAVQKSFEFSFRVTLPNIEDVKESYLGFVNAETIIELMTNEDKELIPNVFYDNVRDFQGDTRVNKEIAETLQTKYKDAFLILNNGITIVAEDLKTTRNTFTISNYQIINGCQTSNVLYENIEKLDNKVFVPIKLISSKNQDLTAKLIRSTNRQTEVKEQDLIAFSNFQKLLEDYYKTYTGKNKLYYERRSKQYSKSGVEKKRIIDKTTQIKSVASFYLDKPDMATRFFGTLFKNLGDKLFDENHKMILYYTSAFVLFRLEEYFRKHIIDKKFKKIKFFLLMMIRYEISNDKVPQFNSVNMEKYCDNIINIVANDSKFKPIIKRIIRKINSLKIDLDDKEISKSKSLVQRCINKY